MNVYVEAPSHFGVAIRKVAAALAQFVPAGVRVMQDPANADLRVWHVCGDGERQQILAGLGGRPRYAVVQYCLRTTEYPKTPDWFAVWGNAQLVWSYYDLAALTVADGYRHGADFYGASPGIAPLINFFHAPLGVDPLIFRHTPRQGDPIKLIGTSGYIADTESVGEWYAVSKAHHARHFHLGPRLSVFGTDPNVVCATGLPDSVLAQQWSRCQYVAAMRRIEGFEMPGIEGLCCGARPVCYRAPHYEQWYGEAAEYVDEGTPEEVIAQLTDLVQRPPRVVGPVEQLWARERFAWKPIIEEFWRRAL